MRTEIAMFIVILSECAGILFLNDLKGARIDTPRAAPLDWKLTVNGEGCCSHENLSITYHAKLSGN